MPRYGRDDIFDKSIIVHWSPSEIRYTREQVEWIYNHWLMLKDGKYPIDPGQKPGGSIKQNDANNATFVTPIEIYAEVDRRALRCGLDWYLLDDCFTKGLDLEDIARLHHVDYTEVWNRLQRALTYIASGPTPRWVTTEKRKGLTYQEWISIRWRRPVKDTVLPLRTIRVSHA